MCELRVSRVTWCSFRPPKGCAMGPSISVKDQRKMMRNDEDVTTKRLFWQPWLEVEAEDSSKQSSNKQLPTTKWKRDRRSRLPEYSRKSDPKIAETFGTEPPSPTTATATTPTTETPNQQAANGQNNAPLDMSVRQRGLPPSYSQTINNPGYRSNYRPSVIQNNAPTREDLPPGISMCDPIIDEHFRRSLGNDYLSLFSNNNVSREPLPVKPPPKVPDTTNVIELMDTAGLSVDDHFAKALGDTWVKLNKKEQEIKNNTSDNHSIVTI